MGNEKYLPGLRGFRYLYFVVCKRDFLKSTKSSLLLTVILIAAYILSPKSGYELIKILIDVVLKLCIPLLAFTLAGYSLIMNKNIEILTEEKTKNGLSMYQKLNVIFIAMLLSTAICVITAVIVYIYSYSDIVIIFCPNLIMSINFFVFLVISFQLSYMLLSVKDLLSNLFSYGQYIQKKSDDKNNKILGKNKLIYKDKM